MSDLDEAMAEFTSECEEMLERISESLSKLEKSGADSETLNSIYRDVHTIKGSSQLFGFQYIGQLAHAAEASLDPLRKGMAQISTSQVDILYKCIDIIARQLKSIVETGKEPSLLEELGKIVPQIVLMTLEGLGGTPHGFNDDVFLDVGCFVGQESEGEGEKVKGEKVKGEVKKEEEKLKEDKNVKGEVKKEVEERGEDEKVKVEAKKEVEKPKEDEKVKDEAKKEVEKPKEEVKKIEPEASSKTPPKAKETKSIDTQDTIRVHVGLLDNLMNLTGELVLIRNQVVQLAAEQGNREFSHVSQRINILTSELQSEVMKTRMQPVGNILNKFHRVVRDLSRTLGKKVELELIGAETELDKALIEAIKDPIVHLVRNAVDHGIEMPSERVSLSKEETGKVTIRSYHEGGQVVIEISEDGRGIDPEKIGIKALEKKIVSEEDLEKMTEHDIMSLIFAPGFSTAASVTNVSGRGVGMDVVKNNIEEIGGTCDLSSKVGEGSTFRLRIPLTLAIVPALIVRSSLKTFAVPQVKLVELIRFEASEGEDKDGIEILQGRPVFRLRGQLVPLVTLKEILTNEKTDTSGIQNIAVLKDDQLTFGLIVDDIKDSAEIVVKPLANFLKSIPIYAGATVLGDGSIALTLDVTGLSKYVSPVAEHGARGASSARKVITETSGLEKEYLIIDIGANNHYALPLEKVNRLEEFDVRLFSISGNQKMVRYRDGLLPTVDICEVFNKESATGKKEQEEKENQSVVVINHEQKLVGFQVKSILDVYSTSNDVDIGLKKKMGLTGNLVIDDKVVPVIDPKEVVESFSESIFGHEKSEQVRRLEEAKKEAQTKPEDFHILCVEDSSFFRKQLKRLLSSYGFKLSFANDGKEGLSFIAENKHAISLIVTDIEMPNMDGFEMSSAVKNDETTKHIPMIAVTTRFRKSDIERGITIGIDRYLEKLNENELIDCIQQLLQIEKMAA